MRIRIGNGRRALHLGNALPLRHEEGARWGTGIFLLLFGLCFTAFPVVLAWQIATGAEVEGDLLGGGIVLGTFGLVGLGMMVLGVRGLRHRYSVDIDGETVRVTRRGLARERRFREPLSAYAGVLGVVTRHRSNNRSYTLHRVVLKHRERAGQDVELYRSRSSKGHRNEIEGFARLLGLPVLAEHPDGTFRERRYQDLDKSVRELAAEGKVEAPARVPSLPPGQNLVVQRDGGALVIDAGYRRGVLGSAIFLAAGLGTLYWYFGPGIDGEGSAWVVPVVGGTFVLFGALALAFCLFGRERLRVDDEEIKVSSEVFSLRLNRRGLPVDEIEEVALRKDRNGRFQVTLATDAEEVTFGRALAMEEKEFVRDCLLAEIAR